LGGSSFHVLAGRLVVAEPDDDDAVEGTVGLAVSAAVEAVTYLFSGGGIDG